LQIWFGFEEAVAALDGQPTALTIGTFDGMHLGHQAVIGELCRRAKQRSLASLVMTFAQHPSLIVKGEAPPLLIPVERRLEMLTALGIKAALLLPFDAALAALEPRTFVRDKLCTGLNARLLIVGYDFRFGAGGSGDATLLGTLGREECGFEVVRVPPMTVGETTVSSTTIRWALASGDVAAVRGYLGRPFSVRGKVVSGLRRGHGLGFPTANIGLALGSLWPRYGVYLVRVTAGASDYDGLANVGVRPTFGRGAPGIEVFLLGYDGDLYGTTIDVAFLDFIRPEKQFSDPGKLRAQIDSDLKQARAILQGQQSCGPGRI